MTEAKRDGNSVTALLGTSNADGVTVLPVYVDSSTNRMLVNATITGTVTVTGAGGSSIVDDAAFTPGTTSLTVSGGMFDDVSPDSVDEGDAGAFRMSSRRELYVQIRDAAGNERGLNVNASGQIGVSGPVTNAGTFAVQVDGAALTSLQLIDDIVKTDDAAFTPGTDKVAMIGAEFDDTTPDSINEGDAGALRMSGRRELYTQIRDGQGNERGAYVNASGQLLITGPVTNAGTFAVQVDGSALTALQLLDDVVFADDAAFTPGSSKVSVVGFIADDTATDSVNEGDAGAARMTLDRKIYTSTELESNAMRISGVSVTPKFAVIDAATSGDNTLVAAVNPKKIRVLAAFMVAAGAVNARFESGAGGTALTGQMNLTTNSGFVLPYNPVGWFETASNTLLNLELSGAVSVDGSLTYIEV